MYERNVKDVTPEEILKDCNLQPCELTVLSVCAPCQPFSRQTRLNRDDERTPLVLEMVRFVKILLPQFAIIENVPGLAKGKNKQILEQLIKELRDDLGYNVSTPQVVDAVNYGTPQFRKRLILLCSRDNTKLDLPPYTHVMPTKAEATNKQKWRIVKDAFKGIPTLSAGHHSPTDPLHKARNHTELNLKRIRHIPHNGGSRNSLPDDLQLKCHKNKSGYNDVYGRLDSNRPANTLTTGCTNFTRGRFAHPIDDRAITPREAARLQTFPDEYKFSGNYEQISSQIGNAVPVTLAEVFAEYFYELWSKDQHR
jgi:DNA (cytosine-5)-methyltransferase 1